MSALQLFVIGFIFIAVICLLILGFVKILDWLVDHNHDKLAITFAIIVFAIIGGLVAMTS
jgi:hypothetical protein